MLETISKFTVLGFGAFFIGAGLVMLFKPQAAREILRKAGSTNLINYAEITIRMIPAAALILYADQAKFPGAFQVVGWFMLLTSLVLLFVPRELHHRFSVSSAEVIKPLYFQCISPISFLIGGVVIYAVI